MKFNNRRLRQLNSIEESTSGPVIYWMDRDMRMRQNGALLFAQQEALQKNVPLLVVYNLVIDFLGGGARQVSFKVQALKELEEDLKKKGIPFLVLLTEDSAKDLVKLIGAVHAGLVVTDFSPLRIQRAWKKTVAQEVVTPLVEVDTHNIVPAWHASVKKEFAAYTFRPKIKKLLPEFLTSFPVLKSMNGSRPKSFPKTDWQRIDKLSVEDDLLQVTICPGEKAARRECNRFINNRLRGYAEARNNPVINGQSGLSPYLHYGQISAQYIALKVMKTPGAQADKAAFLEELIVRRELCDNYCLHEPKYDSYDGFPDWAKQSLSAHENDPREYTYTKKQFELARTHDDAWNAAQNEMVRTGKMHGYMRMYWAKKILEWTKSAKDAMKIAVYLNDKYEMDGRDPNGYVGCAWSIGGVHDRAWFDREIYGKVRYMNRNGLKRKFDLESYVKKYT